MIVTNMLIAKLLVLAVPTSDSQQNVPTRVYTVVPQVILIDTIPVPSNTIPVPTPDPWGQV